MNDVSVREEVVLGCLARRLADTWKLAAAATVDVDDAILCVYFVGIVTVSSTALG